MTSIFYYRIVICIIRFHFCKVFKKILWSGFGFGQNHPKFLKIKVALNPPNSSLFQALRQWRRSKTLAGDGHARVSLPMSPGPNDKGHGTGLNMMT